MKRIIYEQLIKWKDSNNRKPLVIYGARQVGKTYILQEFGKQEFENLIYINCHKNEEIERLFTSDKDVKRIVLGLSAYANQSINQGKTLVFLDEIQEIPPIISSLKYFCEDMSNLHIAVAGSLLGVMNMRNESYPVGKVDTLHLYPMTFEEFLWAMDKKQLADLLEGNDNEMTDIFGKSYIESLRQYYFVGGMPEAVLSFSQNQDIIAVRKIQNEILAAYESDIAKHTGQETQRIRMVWHSIPAQLARENKKFIYGAIRKGARAVDFEIAIQWLIDAGLIYKVERTRDVKIPLKFYADMDIFKIYLLDVGLLGAMTMTPPRQILIGDNVFCEYKGAFTENYVLQEMKTIPQLPVYYYSKDNSSQKVDFIVQAGSQVLPIEVKAEENVKSKSLRAFITQDFKCYELKGVRFSMKGYEEQDWMTNVPLYSAKSFVKKKISEESSSLF
ncbi:MAG: ATP-binding protein [Paludibacteraceae bacterium]